MHRFLLLPIVVFFAATVAAEDAKPLEQQTADQVEKAIQGNRPEALKALVKRKPDPWHVAEELSIRGAHDAAQACCRGGCV